MSDNTEVKGLIEQIGRAHEEFKASVEKQLTEAKAGRNDAVLDEKITKLSDRLTELQEQKDAIEKRMNRQGLGGEQSAIEAKAVEDFNREIKSFARQRGQAVPADLTADEMRSYKSAFTSVLRKNDNQLTDSERKSLVVGVDADGGYLVPADVSGRIVTRLFDLSPIRGIANVQIISSDRLEGIEDLDEAAFGWVGETSARSETNTPRVGKYEIPANEMYAQPKASQKLLDDAAVDAEAWLSGKVAERFARAEGAAFVAGDGVEKPRGFTAYSTAATADASRAWGTLEHVNTGVNGAFAASNPADILFDLEGAFKPGYLAGASWVTRRSVLTLIRKFKGSDNNYLWQPGLAAGRPSTLIGYPVVMAEDMPALGTASLSLALGNFGLGYQIVDRLGIRVLRDPYTEKPYVKFYTTKRTGGAVVNFETIKFVRFGT